MHSIYRLTVGFIAPLNSWFVPGDVLAPNDYYILSVMTYCHPIITTYQAEFLLKTLGHMYRIPPVPRSGEKLLKNTAVFLSIIICNVNK